MFSPARVLRVVAMCGLIAACSSTKTNVAASDGGRRAGGGVLQHHNHASRDGVYIEPSFTKVVAGAMHLDPTFAPTYTGPVSAQPLYLDGGGGVPDLVFVATEQNHVYAFDAATGRQVWDRLLGSQAIRPTSVCSPGPVGIRGTPIIDGASRVLYVDALTGGATHKHLVFALDVDTGQTRPGWPVDVDATAHFGMIAFDSSTQNQRGALALVNGTLFIPYGGFAGDCGVYHGFVVGIATTDPTDVTAWATRGAAGGVWAPGGIASDGTSIYFSTGNTVSMTWQDGESVFKVPPSLVASGNPTDYFAPADWSALDATDADLGCTAPVLFDVPGATPSALLMLFGKDTKAYVLDRNNLGGLGAAPVAGGPLLWWAIVSAPSTFTTARGTYVVTRGPVNNCESGINSGHLAAIKVSAGSPPTLSVPWCNLVPDTGGSPVVSMTDAQGSDAIVWIVAKDDKLYALDAESGVLLLGGSADAIPNVNVHQPAIIAKGRIFIAGNDRVYTFRAN